MEHKSVEGRLKGNEGKTDYVLSVSLDMHRIRFYAFESTICNRCELLLRIVSLLFVAGVWNLCVLF